MKTFKNAAAQGDLMLRKIESVPANAVPVKADNGVYVLAHSETGHNHVVMERPGVTLLRDPVDQFRGFLIVSGEPAELQHLRGHDTHETIAIQPGMYELRRQREYDAFEGVRRAQD